MQDDEGMTPLHYAAAIKGRSEIWELLVVHGADENLRNFNGDTPTDMLNQY
jgi:ankyrin repeat protein